MEELIKMSLSDFPRFVNDDDPELGIAKALFLSTRPNSHGFNISEEVLKKFAPTILGKFLVGNLNAFETDVMSHELDPDIFGYIPFNQDIEFVRASDGYLDAYANIVVSKIYATKVYDLFLEDNFRNVSVEMRVMYENEKTKDVAEFNIAGLTVLGKAINPSVPQAHIEMVRFSVEEAENYYNTTFNQIQQMTKLAEVGKRYKINKTAKAMSNGDWSSVDKTKLRNTILKAQNKSTLVKSVYLKVDSNWEEAPSERLGYPVMELKGDTFVYNRNALANAKARAEQQNETEVLRKLNAIYNKLNLNETENKNEAEDKMAKLEEQEKDVVMEKPTEEANEEQETKLSEDAKSEEDATLAEEKSDSQEDKKDDEKQEEKLSDDSSDEEDKKEDDDSKEEEDKLAQKEAECAELEAKCAELEAKLSELEKFKADTENKEKMSIVTQTLAQVKESMDEEIYAKFEEKAKDYTIETINVWRNEVLANVATVLMSKGKDESHLRMGMETSDNIPKGLWDRM